MDPVQDISLDVKLTVGMLGAEIIHFAAERTRISGSADLSEAQKQERIGAARERLHRHMEAAFGRGEGSIIHDIDDILETARQQEADFERARKAADIWREELPGLRRFLEYCAVMIEEHPGEVSPQVRESQRCITNATVVLEKISIRMECELEES